MYKTELTEQILKSPMAQTFIQRISPLYGDAYVVLWLIQAIGTVIDSMEEWSGTYEKQIVPQTATWSIPFWEEQYGIVADPSWSDERRRQNIVNRIKYRAPINPKKIEEIASVAAGHPAEVEELTGKNKFTVYIRDLVYDLEPIRTAINEVKPAHLIFDLVVGELAESFIGHNEIITASEHEVYEAVVLMS